MLGTGTLDKDEGTVLLEDCVRVSVTGTCTSEAGVDSETKTEDDKSRCGCNKEDDTFAEGDLKCEDPRCCWCC